MDKNYQFLDIEINKTIHRKLTAIQYDNNSRYILVSIYSNFKPYDLTYATVKIYGIKKDKTVFFNNAKILDAKAGKFEIDLTEQCLAVAGDVEIQILILGANQERLSSNNFILNVKKNIIDSVKVTSESQWGVLTEGLASLAEYDVYKNGVDRHDNQIKKLEANVIYIPKTNDDTKNLKEALLTNSKTILLEKNKNYYLNDTLQIENKTLDLNGSTLNFVLKNRQSGLVMGSNSILRNGKIKGTDEDYIEPVLPAHLRHVGLVSISSLTYDNLVQNCIIENVEIENLTNLSSRFAIAGKSYAENIEIKNVRIKLGENASGGIGFEWVSDYQENSLQSPSTLNCVKNIKIDNVIFEEFNSLKDDAKIMFFSAVYNLDISNVIIKKTNSLGLYISDGDWGFYENSNFDNIFGGKSITVRNVQIYTSDKCVQFVNDGGLSRNAQPMNVVFENCNFIGGKSKSSSLISNDCGVFIFSYKNSSLNFSNCIFENNEIGLSFVKPDINNVKVNACVFTHNNTAIHLKSFSDSVDDLINNIDIEKNSFIDNVYYNSIPSNADIVIEDAKNINISNNYFNRTTDFDNHFISILKGKNITSGVDIIKNEFKAKNIQGCCDVGDGSTFGFLGLVYNNSSNFNLIQGQRIIPIKKYSFLAGDEYLLNNVVTVYVSSSDPQPSSNFNKNDICYVSNDGNLKKLIFNGVSWI